jgi:hypothetical protein
MEILLHLFSDFPHEALATLDSEAVNLNMAAGLLCLRNLLGECVWGVRVTKGYYFS